MRHSKEVLVELLPKVLRYSIPLYLPSERLVFKASELILEFKPHNMPDYICFDTLRYQTNNPPSLYSIQVIDADLQRQEIR